MGTQLFSTDKINLSRSKRRRRTLSCRGGAALATPSAIEMLERRQMFNGIRVFDQQQAIADFGSLPVQWDTSTQIWINPSNVSGGDVAWNNSAGDIAVFSSNMSSMSIELSTTINAAGVEFNVSGVALYGHPIVFNSAGGFITSPASGWGEIDNNLSGGPVNASGGGTVILAGSNTFNSSNGSIPTLNVLSGTLQVGRNGSTNSLGAGLVNVSNGSSLAFDLASPTTFPNNIFLTVGSQTINILGSTTTLSGVISGGGNVGVGNPIGGGDDDGTGDGGSGSTGNNGTDLVMTGDNTYSGTTTIGNGADVSVPGSIASDNVIVNPGSSLSTEPDSFDSPTTHLQDNGTFDYSDPTNSIDSPETDVVVSGSGVLTVTGGALIVKGSNTFSGTTNISYGTLSLQNYNSSGTGSSTVTVMAGSTLDGTGGTEGNITVDAGGYLTAGTRNAIGMPSVGMLNAGNVSMNTGSTFGVMINYPSSPGFGYDQLNVNGTMTIANGSNLAIVNTPLIGINQSMTVIHTTLGITGSFSNVVPGINTSSPGTLTFGGQTYDVSTANSGEDLVLTVIYSAPALSISQVSTTVVAGQPATFRFTATGSGGIRVKGWDIHFDSFHEWNNNVSAGSTSGNVYTWDVQYIFPATASGTYNISASANHNSTYPMPFPSVFQVTVASAVSSVDFSNPNLSAGTIQATGAIPQSSTQMNVYYESNSSFASMEVAAADQTAGSQTFTVVAAAPGPNAIGGGLYRGATLVSGLTPGHNYYFLVYGINASGSVCSVNNISNSTFVTPTLSEEYIGSQYTYTGSYDSRADSYSIYGDGGWMPDNLLTPSMRAFDSSGNPIATSFNNTNPCIASFATNPAYVTFDTTAAPLYSQTSGAFDSITYYNIAPTYVLTGTSGNNTFYVSIDRSTGAYKITGSVTPIAPFYAQDGDGIDLQVYGRGGADSLNVGSGATVHLMNDPSADGTILSISGSVSNNYSSSTLSASPPPAALTLPLPTSPSYDTIPTAGDTFTPPLTASSNDGNVIQQATATAGPGDVIALTTYEFDPEATERNLPSPSITTSVASYQFYVYGQTTSGNAYWNAATILSVANAAHENGDGGSLYAVSIQLPASLPPDSLYFLYEQKTDSYGVTTLSQPYEINQPQVWWMNENENYAGGKVSVFGTNLAYNVNPATNIGQSWVYLFPSNSSGGITSGATPIILPVSTVAGDANDGSGAMDVNPYKVDFYLPQNLSAGSYQVEIYNGHGGIYGLSSATVSGAVSLLTVAATPTFQTFSLQDAYTDAIATGRYGSGSAGGIWLDEGAGRLDPAAVNIAINWSSGAANSSSESYIAIQLPTGSIEITDSSDIISLLPHVHLVGAGDTEDAHSGTLIEANVSSGSTVEGLIKLPDMTDHLINAEIAVSDMSLNSHDKLGPQGANLNWYGAIFDEGNLEGATLQRLTINTTADDPASPVPSGEDGLDVWINDYAIQFQVLDSTMIGSGFSGGAQQSVFDNCHFIGCDTIYDVIGGQSSFEVSISRITVTSLVNNVLYPGGNVAEDSSRGLAGFTLAYPGMYVGNCSTSDIYNANYNFGDGEQISMEPSNTSTGAHITISTIIYQNTLSGDGFETLQNSQDTVGISINVGDNMVVVDNDVSNVRMGIEFWGGGGDLVYHMPFDIASGNSIHNILIGFDIAPTGPVSDDQPWFVGNSFSHNLISGGQPNSTGIFINLLPGDSTCATQILMNVFNSDVVTGVAYAVDFNPSTFDPVNQADVLILAGGFFRPDGSSLSSLEIGESSGYTNPASFFGGVWQGFWNLPPF